MQAAQGVGNMTLAHEIVVDPDFRFNKQEPPPNRLVVLPRMHDTQALFWYKSLYDKFVHVDHFT